MTTTRRLMIYAFMVALGSTVGFIGGWQGMFVMWGTWIATFVRYTLERNEADAHRQRVCRR